MIYCLFKHIIKTTDVELDKRPNLCEPTPINYVNSENFLQNYYK